MSLKRITTRVNLGEDKGYLIIQSIPSSSILAINYKNHNSKAAAHTFSFNKFSLISLKKYGNINSLESDIRYQVGSNRKKLVISISEHLATFTVITNKNSTTLEITDKSVIVGIIDHLLPHIANIRMTLSTYNEIINQLESAGFTKFIAELICYLICIHPNRELMYDAAKNESSEKFMNIICNNDIMDSKRYKIKAFLNNNPNLRNSDITKICNALKENDIETVRDLLNFGYNSINKIHGISDNYQIEVKKSIKPFIEYCK